MFKGFREFVLRGNVVDLAVAVVIGAAFRGVVDAFVDDILTPAAAAVFGQPDLSGLAFPVNSSVFKYGLFINSVVSFLLIAAAIYYVVVAPMNKLTERRVRGADPVSKQCPQCLSDIPPRARRCDLCASLQEDPGGV